jgi:SAM-dependent methyltransferase
MNDRDRSLIDEQIAYYRRRAPEYDVTSSPPGDPLAPQGKLLEAALDAFEPRGRVLELACGTGGWTRHLLRHATELTALDSSPEMVGFNRARLNDPRVAYVLADIFSWEPERTYDVVAFANWLSHVPPSRFHDFWGLVGKCLSPTGRVFFVDEAADAWRGEETLAEEFLDHQSTPLVLRTLRDGSRHRVIKVFWDPMELEAVLRALGWDIAIHTTGPFYWGAGCRLST